MERMGNLDQVADTVDGGEFGLILLAGYPLEGIYGEDVEEEEKEVSCATWIIAALFALLVLAIWALVMFSISYYYFAEKHSLAKFFSCCIVTIFIVMLLVVAKKFAFRIRTVE
ncbi:hypothetical protein TYRP_005433 [Tyrophagus putrescentiae]|nr:hypothetical protein TYRP_005433 [Tyrophagus putrescentiae]